MTMMPATGSELHFEQFPVSEHLSCWISGFFRWAGPLPERILPNAQFDLLFSLGDDPIDPNEVRVDRSATSVLYGELRQPQSGLGEGTVDLFGVSMYPWTTDPLTGSSALALNGKVFPLGRLGRIESERVRRMLRDCSSDIDRIRLLEEVLSRILPPPGKIEISLHRQWTATLESGGRTEWSEIDDPDLDETRFRKIYHRRVGMTPRQLSRLARFHTFLRRLERGEKISTLAQEIGYYDQAHLTRECRDFAGLPPRQLHVRLASGGHVFKRGPLGAVC